MSKPTRREFLAASSAFLSATALGQATPAPLTAGDVITRIKQQVGIPWREKAVDNLLTGTPATQVRGIATTMMATLDVIQRCAARNLNMIVTHETPFYLHQDQTADIANDPVLRYKLDFCQKHNIALFHFHDHWHARKPDGIAEGMVAQLGWQKNVDDPMDPKRLTFPGIPLGTFVHNMQQTLDAKTMRVLGDPALPVHRVQTSWGFMGREDGIRIFSDPSVDVLICGETREWELVEYCQDSLTMGNKKALIVVGHVLSEQGGMMLCQHWLKSFIPEVPIEFIAAKEPFWNAAQAPA